MFLRPIFVALQVAGLLATGANNRDAGLFNEREGLVKSGVHSRKVVCLTFDDGPHPTATASILMSLRAANAPGTFFVVGREMKKYPNLVKEMLSYGNEVGNHTLDHVYLDRLDAKGIEEELNGCQQIFESITGKRMTLMRPPGMHYNQEVFKVAKSLGYLTVDYNVGAKDYVMSVPKEKLQPELRGLPPLTPALVESRVLSQIRPGAIILLHENPIVAAALPGLIHRLQSDGYSFVSIRELLEELPQPVTIDPNPAAR